MSVSYNIKKASIVLSVVVMTTVACKDDFLSVPAPGALSESILTSKAGVEGMLISAYGIMLGRGLTNVFVGGSTNWFGGSVQGGDANKGSESGDASVMNAGMRYEMTPSHQVPDWKWAICYESIARANTVLRLVDKAADMSAADKTRVKGEARFLRGHAYFELQKHFNKVPYIDETLSPDAAAKVPNTGTVWTQIEADFNTAYTTLPETQAAAGRANKWAAGTYLAKAYLYQKKYDAAATLFETIIANGKTTNGKKYGLAANFNDVFSTSTENNEEHVFSVQAAANSGTNLNSQTDYVLNFIQGTSIVGCCGFFQPSFDMVNSYRTDANGLPLLDGSYNAAANRVAHDYGIESAGTFTPDAGRLDPRLDWTVGRRGIPFYDWQKHPGKSWIRAQDDAGPFSPKKFMMTKAQYDGVTDGSSWTKGFTAINYPLLRFADVLLMAAEAHIDKPTADLEKARTYINMVRTRAANPAGFVKDGAANAANYVINNYTTAFASPAIARDAVRMERKLELSQEGHRFYDIVRWGVAKAEIDRYIGHDATILVNRLSGANNNFKVGKSEYWPIPQSQIDLQGADVLKQNPNY